MIEQEKNLLTPEELQLLQAELEGHAKNEAAEAVLSPAEQGEDIPAPTIESVQVEIADICGEEQKPDQVQEPEIDALVSNPTRQIMFEDLRRLNPNIAKEFNRHLPEQELEQAA